MPHKGDDIIVVYSAVVVQVNICAERVFLGEQNVPHQRNDIVVAYSVITGKVAGCFGVCHIETGRELGLIYIGGVAAGDVGGVGYAEGIEGVVSA